MSHAPGLAGTPDTGHCSRAATRASWASSSARPTSRTICARPAISRADSMRQTASIMRWVSDVLGLGGRLGPQALVLLPQLRRVRGPELFRLDHLTDLNLERTQASLQFRGLHPSLPRQRGREICLLPSRASGRGESPSPAGDGPDDQERLRAGRHRLRQWRIRWVIREILLAGVKPDEGPTLVRDLVADGAAEHRIAGLERIED